nr:DUF3857 domain-containing protein [Desulfobacterales bacterium]
MTTAKTEVEDIWTIIEGAPSADMYPDADGIVLLNHKDYVVKEDLTTFYTLRQVIKILNDRGMDTFAEIKVKYSAPRQAVVLDQARTITPDGTVVEAEDAVKTVTGSSLTALSPDIRYMLVRMPGLRPGAVIDYRVTVINRRSLVPNHFWDSFAVQNSVPVLFSRYRVILPVDKDIQYVVYKVDVKPRICLSEKRKTYTWEIKDSSASMEPPTMFSSKDSGAKIGISSFRSWNEVAKWYLKQFEGRTTPDEAIKVKTLELINGKNRFEEKVRAIYDYVNSNIQYVGDNIEDLRYQPLRASEVFRRRRGDCKDQAALLISMLSVAGISCHPVLLRAVEHDRVDQQLPTLKGFRHLINVVPHKEGHIWLDCTLHDNSGTELPPQDQGRSVLIISDKTTKLTVTPIFFSKANTETFHGEMSLSANGLLEGRLTWRLTGNPFQLIGKNSEEMLSTGKQSRLKKRLEAMCPGASIEIMNITPLSLEGRKQGFTVTFQFRAENYASIQDGLLLLKQGILPPPFFMQSVGRCSRESLWTVWFSSSVIKELEVNLPEGYQIKNLPEEFQVKTSFASLRSKSWLDKGKLFYSSILLSEKPKITATEYRQWQDLLKAAAQADEQLITLEGKR